MKKNRKKMIAFLLAVSCLAGSRFPACATETPEEKIPRVVFENEERESPDLYVIKKVESASAEYPAPEGEAFTFTLRLGGQPADRLTYRLFGADGKEIFRSYFQPELDEPPAIPWPFRTDRNGTFTLKAGQSALFEDVGVGTAYEVTEGEKEGYEQIRPEGGAAAAGTVTKKGARAEFTNLYLPEGPGDKVRLEVRKTVSFPAGYEAPETPEFSFRLELDGKEYGNEPYTVADTETGKELAEGVTDGAGTFTLRGGQTAVFADIALPEGVDSLDYRVEELPFTGEGADLWRAAGETIREGATASPVTPVVFNNASASFAVTKRMEDGSRPETDFTFLLTKADRRVWAEAPYYLYYTTGERAEEALLRTGKDGTFPLKAGQTAVFVGTAPGTLYSVSEQGDPDYIQTVPLQAEGYTDKAVTDAVEELVFVNREAEMERSLNVTKIIENTTEDAPLVREEFHFILYKENAAGEFEPVTGAVYRIRAGLSEHTYATEGEEGTPGAFTLKADETARFSGIAPGTYKVAETDLSPEYRVKTEEGEGAEKTAEVKKDGEPAEVVFTNLYTPKKLDLYLAKKDRGGESLAGAEFMLYRDAALENPVEGGPYTSQDGELKISGLKAGTYYLKETKAPAGYRLPAKAVKLEILQEKTGARALVDGKECAGKDVSGDAPGENCIVLKENGNSEIHLTVYNSKSYALPLTGGTGTGLSLLAGAACTVMLLRVGRRKKQKPDGKKDAGGTPRDGI